MEEDFLHFIWSFQLFDHIDLRTVEGDPVQVISAGNKNTNSGPDFNEAQVRIAGNLWIGNVELHVQTKEWFLHQHQFDPAYSNVILHVVFKHDYPKWNKEEHASIPIVELKDRIDLHKYAEWEKLKNQNKWIPCESLINRVPSVLLKQMVTRAAIERLQRKVNDIEAILARTRGNWEHVLVHLLLASFGAKVNKNAFQTLALLLPFPLIKRFESDPFKLQALLFGSSGLLDQDFFDEYPLSLKREYEFLCRKYDLIKMNKEQWKFMRMRPSNFPSLRIAQLAAIFSTWTYITSLIFYDTGISKLEKALRIDTHPYWKNHYRFDCKARVNNIKMGEQMTNTILINAIAPFIYTHAHHHVDDSAKDRALTLMEILKPEVNSIITKWKKLVDCGQNSLETQGLIELKNKYCSFKKCLSCKVGVWILNSK
jgi:hypothetical protein